MTVINNYRDPTDRIIEQIRTTVKKLTFKLQAKIKNEKLTGQVLNVRTGRLRRSINAEFQELSGGLIQGLVGTNVPYAKPHEYGFSGEQQVKEYVQKRKQVFGRMLKDPIQVTIRAHVRHVNIPEKSFMRSALEELRPEIIEEFQAAIKRGLSGTKS
jgi:phage gpG-like protein